MVVVVRAASKVPIADRTAYSNFGERALGSGHVVITRLVAGVRDVTCT